MPTLEIKDLLLHYTVHGEGFPVILLHGSFSTGESAFGPLIPYLAAHYMVICPDMRGHGNTRCESLAWSVPELASDILALMKALNIPIAHIIGHSMGGDVAMTCGFTAPEYCQTLISIGSAGMPNRQLLAHLARLDPDYGAEKIYPRFFEDLKEKHYPAHKGDWKTLFRMTVASCMRTFKFSEGNLDQLNMPFMLVYGSKDKFVLQSELDLLAACCKNFSKQEIPNTGHTPQNDPEALPRTAKIILDFLKANTG